MSLHKKKKIHDCFVVRDFEPTILIKGVQIKGVQLKGVLLKGVQIKGVRIKVVQIKGVRIKVVQIKGVQIKDSKSYKHLCKEQFDRKLILFLMKKGIHIVNLKIAKQVLVAVLL